MTTWFSASMKSIPVEGTGVKSKLTLVSALQRRERRHQEVEGAIYQDQTWLLSHPSIPCLFLRLSSLGAFDFVLAFRPLFLV